MPLRDSQRVVKMNYRYLYAKMRLNVDLKEIELRIT